MAGVFRFKRSTGFLNSARNAQAVGERLTYLRDTTGSLKPATVVEDARPADATLHEYFEWDDTVASEKWRLFQARKLVSAVHVVVEDADGESVTTRAFIHVTDEDGDDPRYESIAAVLNDSALYAQVCRRALGDLDSFRERYAQFESLTRIGTTARSAVQLELDSAMREAVPA